MSTTSSNSSACHYSCTEVAIKDPSPETLAAYGQPIDSNQQLWLFSSYMKGPANSAEAGGTVMRPLADALNLALKLEPNSMIIRRRLDWTHASVEKAEVARNLDESVRKLSGIEYETSLLQLPAFSLMGCVT